ncbi:MAG: glutamate formimidoyltransferase [Candidatus Brocadiia bacterium]
MQIVECVPNFSEGRRSEVVDQILREITLVKGVKLLDKEMDFNHNRVVVTFIGTPAGVGQAAFSACKKASELIDLTKHKGEHPRMGATDVIPFIPIREIAMGDCIKIARQVGQDIGVKLGIPVYLYEEASTRPERKNLANVRKGEFEGLSEEIGKNPERTPDFGPNRIHPTAGATVVGARMVLVAFNVNLASNDLILAKKIAKTIRESSGGMPNVKALGLMLHDRNIAQISMNLTNYKVSSPKMVFDRIKQLAGESGAKILESELIGLAPQETFQGTSPQELKIANFSSDQIIENRIKDL